MWHHSASKARSVEKADEIPHIDPSSQSPQQTAGTEEELTGRYASSWLCVAVRIDAAVVAAKCSCAVIKVFLFRGYILQATSIVRRLTING